MPEKKLYILWDETHIWGLMALRAVRALGLPCRLIKATEITQGLLSCKPPAMLLIPGGSARLKARALGTTGMRNIQEYVAKGGYYLGFCGGAGFALSEKKEHSITLGLCPWTRAACNDRLQHLVSGHVHVHTSPNPLVPHFAETPQAPMTPSLPVWWPGRFAVQPPQGKTYRPVEPLATYAIPDADFWVADLPLHSVPQHIFETWKTLHGVNLSADFLADQPLIISGSHGDGTYILSYSHLETPHSPDANHWLCHIFNHAGFPQTAEKIPDWELDTIPNTWEHIYENNALYHAIQELHTLLTMGEQHNLLFKRTPWLMGWRAGIPGAALNNLRATLHTTLSTIPTGATYAYWHKHRAAFETTFGLFREGAEDYLLAERLATTLSPSLPSIISSKALRNQREALFGHPMNGGGLIGELIQIADELVYLSETQ